MAFVTNCKNCSMCCNVKAFVDCDDWFIGCSDEDVTKIAEHTGKSLEEFSTKGHSNRGNVLKIKDNGDCVFRTDNGCGIYESRPSICKKFAESSPCLFFPERSEQN